MHDIYGHIYHLVICYIAMENANHKWRFSSMGKSSISMGHLPLCYKLTYNWYGFHPKWCTYDVQSVTLSLWSRNGPFFQYANMLVSHYQRCSYIDGNSVYLTYTHVYHCIHSHIHILMGESDPESTVADGMRQIELGDHVYLKVSQ